MAHKTFISYKYSDARWLREAIIDALQDDAAYYRGEDGFSEDLSGYTAETIKEHLKNIIYDTSVTILILSPEMLQSEWIPWEIEYSLKDVKRGDRCSHSNGIVGVIMRVDGGYSWIKTTYQKPDGCIVSTYDDAKVPPIVAKNRCNQIPRVYVCDDCKSINELNGSYIAYVTEEEFLRDPIPYIENAFEKSQRLDNYVISERA